MEGRNDRHRRSDRRSVLNALRTFEVRLSRRVWLAGTCAARWQQDADAPRRERVRAGAATAGQLHAGICGSARERS
ncbi:MAG: hypothetical protein QOF46_389 [Paraburkholderia sp.]|nr:hypothetical protein [Paraburkholderia sp.]